MSSILDIAYKDLRPDQRDEWDAAYAVEQGWTKPAPVGVKVTSDTIDEIEWRAAEAGHPRHGYDDPLMNYRGYEPFPKAGSLDDQITWCYREGVARSKAGHIWCSDILERKLEQLQEAARQRKVAAEKAAAAKAPAAAGNPGDTFFARYPGLETALGTIIEDYTSRDKNLHDALIKEVIPKCIDALRVQLDQRMAQKTQRNADLQKQIATLQQDVRELRKWMNTKTLLEQYPNAQISVVQTAD